MVRVPKRTNPPSPAEGQKAVALLGFAESWKLAPFDNPKVTIAGLNELHKYVPRWDVWFEQHDTDTLGVTKRDLTDGEMLRHLDWLKRDHGKPIFMQGEFCDGRFPSAVRYPLEDMIEMFGRYFTSTIGYMIAWAIAEDFDWIGLYGIELASTIEYEKTGQRQNAEYLLGIAQGLGKSIYIPPESALLKAGHLYGYEKPLEENANVGTVLRSHLSGLEKKRDEAIATLNTLDGAIQEGQNTLRFLEYSERGCQIKTY